MENTKKTICTKEDFLNHIIEKNCWSFIAGAGTGSMVSLAFGEKILRHKPLKNPTLTQEQRAFDGEFIVFIKEAPWRILDENKSTICTSDDNNEVDGLMLSGLKILIGSPVSAISITHERFSISFKNRYSFIIRTPSKPDEDSDYSLFHNGCLI